MRSYDPGVGLEVVFGVGDGAALSLSIGVTETVGVESGRRAGAGLGVVFGVGDGVALSPAVSVGEAIGVGSGSRAGAGLDAGCGSDGRAAGEGDGVALARISLRRFRICSRLYSGTR